MQRVGAKMAALCSPQEITQPGTFYPEEFSIFYVVVAIKALYNLCLFIFNLFSFRQPRRVLTIL